MKNNNAFYSPALRMKKGELNGLATLAANVAERVVPRFVVPPRADRNVDQGELFVVNNEPNVSHLLSQHWPLHPAFVEVTHLVKECGLEHIGMWLPKMFDRARTVGLNTIPFLRMSKAYNIDAFRSAIDRKANLKIGICLDESDLVESDIKDALGRLMDNLALSPQDCAIIADLSDADFSAVEIAAQVVGASLEKLQELGRWHYTIFQGTHYPAKNPAEANASEIWPRNEWLAWRKAVNFDRKTPPNLLFGDFAADCAKMAFGAARAPAIRHYRYTTRSASWLIQRAAEIGKDRERMREVCKRIIASGHYDGADFSFADAFIFRTAEEGGTPGNSTTWRQINTNRHITRVVVDIAGLRDLDIRRRGFQPAQEQPSLFVEARR